MDENAAVTVAQLRMIMGEFLAQLEPRFERIDQRFERIDQRFNKLEQNMKAVLGNQRNEASAIEFELRELIRDHMKQAHPMHRSVDFPMRLVKHPRLNRDLTDLDAAFVLQQWSPSTLGDERMREVAALLRVSGPAPLRSEASLPPYFVLVEAKHLVTRQKVVQKLRQAAAMVVMWEDFRRVRGMALEEAVAEGFCRAFHATAQTLHLARADSGFDPRKHFRIYIGGALWEARVRTELEEAIEAARERPEELGTLERRWTTPVASADERDGLDEFVERYLAQPGAGILPHLGIVVPSGSRYKVAAAEAPQPAPSGTLRGGKTGSTPKRRARSKKHKL